MRAWRLVGLNMRLIWAKPSTPTCFPLNTIDEPVHNNSLLKCSPICTRNTTYTVNTDHLREKNKQSHSRQMFYHNIPHKVFPLPSPVNAAPRGKAAFILPHGWVLMSLNMCKWNCWLCFLLVTAPRHQILYSIFPFYLFVS